MTEDMLSRLGCTALRAAMSGEPRIVEAKTVPGIARIRTMSQLQRAMVERVPGFVPSTAADRRDDARAEARILNRAGE